MRVKACFDLVIFPFLFFSAHPSVFNGLVRGTFVAFARFTAVVNGTRADDEICFLLLLLLFSCSISLGSCSFSLFSVYPMKRSCVLACVYLRYSFIFTRSEFRRTTSLNPDLKSRNDERQYSIGSKI